MVKQPGLIEANVFHKRLFDKVNQFNYQTYYLSLPLNDLYNMKSSWMIGFNRPGIMSFHYKDHGDRRGGPLMAWLEKEYAKHHLIPDKNIVLITMPRIIGYVFNPISFWLNYNDDKKLTSVLCEVNNTYGETHNYICVDETNHFIDPNQWYWLDKYFHVSPFLARNGQYAFNFNVTQARLCIRIYYYNAKGELKLITSVSGTRKSFNPIQAFKCYMKAPFMTFKVISAIYWQAIKLKFKGIKFQSKPEKLETTSTTNAKNNKH
jgi:DUF1365 family protein